MRANTLARHVQGYCIWI